MKTVYTLLLLFFSFNLSAQITFEKGYFINNQNQKIECLIKNQDWAGIPKEIEYQLTETSSVEKTNFNQINAFHIYNTPHYYKKQEINIDQNTDQKGFNPNLETVILKVLVEGKASLYIDDKNLFFYQKEDGDIKQLIYKKYIDNSFIIETHQFRMELYNNLNCSSKTQESFQKIRYNKRVFIIFFNDYNKCENADFSDYTKDQTKAIFNFKIISGIEFSKNSLPVPINIKASPSLGGEYYMYNYKLESESYKPNFTLGFETEVLLPFHKNKWSLFMAPNYQKVKYEPSKKIKNVYGNGTIYGDFDYSYIEIPIGIRHYFNVSEKSKLFLDGAYSFIYMINKSENTSIDYQYIPENLIVNDNVNDSKFDNSLRLGFGYNYNNKYSLAINYSKKELSQSDIGSFSLLISYKLF